MSEVGADGSHRDLVVVGTSAGGVDALPRLLGQLPVGLAAAILVVQHLTPSPSTHLVEIVQRATTLPVRWGEHGEPIQTGEIVIAPPALHMVVEGGHVTLVGGPRVNHARPSIDVLFRSAARHHRGRVIGVLLTGMLDDGVAGLRAIRAAGGVVAVQDPDDASFGALPRAALDDLVPDVVAPIDRLGAELERLIAEPPRVVTAPVAVEAGPAATPPHGVSVGVDPDTERALWAAVRSLQERAASLAQLADKSRMVGSALASHYERKSAESYADATRARRFLLERQERRNRRTITSRRSASDRPAARVARRGRRA